MLDAIADALKQAVAVTMGQTDPVTDPVDRLIIVLGGNTLAPSIIQEELGLKHRPTFRANYLHPAMKRGVVEMTRPEVPQSRLQQYRLTEAGRVRWRELVDRSI